MKIHAKDFRVREGQAVELKKWPTLVKPVFKSKSQYQDLLQVSFPRSFVFQW